MVMHESAALPLSHRRVYGSRNPEETQAFMAAKEFSLELAPREAKAFDFVANVGYLPGSYIGYIQYGAAATIRVPDIRARDDYWVHLPVRGGCEITNKTGTLVCTRGRAVISSPVGSRQLAAHLFGDPRHHDQPSGGVARRRPECSA